MLLYSAIHVTEKTWTYMLELPKHANLLSAFMVLCSRDSGWLTAHKSCRFFFNFLDARCTLKDPKMQILLNLFCVPKPWWEKNISNSTENILGSNVPMLLGSLKETLLPITQVGGRECRLQAQSEVNSKNQAELRVTVWDATRCLG